MCVYMRNYIIALLMDAVAACNLICEPPLRFIFEMSEGNIMLSILFSFLFVFACEISHSYSAFVNVYIAWCNEILYARQNVSREEKLSSLGGKQRKMKIDVFQFGRIAMRSAFGNKISSSFRDNNGRLNNIKSVKDALNKTIQFH